MGVLLKYDPEVLWQDAADTVRARFLCSVVFYVLKYHSRSRVISIYDVSGSFYNIGLRYLKQTSKGHWQLFIFTLLCRVCGFGVAGGSWGNEGIRHKEGCHRNSSFRSLITTGRNVQGAKGLRVMSDRYVHMYTTLQNQALFLVGSLAPSDLKPYTVQIAKLKPQKPQPQTVTFHSF